MGGYPIEWGIFEWVSDGHTDMIRLWHIKKVIEFFILVAEYGIVPGGGMLLVQEDSRTSTPLFSVFQV